MRAAAALLEGVLAGGIHSLLLVLHCVLDFAWMLSCFFSYCILKVGSHLELAWLVVITKLTALQLISLLKLTLSWLVSCVELHAIRQWEGRWPRGQPVPLAGDCGGLAQ